MREETYARICSVADDLYSAGDMDFILKSLVNLYAEAVEEGRNDPIRRTCKADSARARGSERSAKSKDDRVHL